MNFGVSEDDVNALYNYLQDKVGEIRSFEDFIMGF